MEKTSERVAIVYGAIGYIEQTEDGLVFNEQLTETDSVRNALNVILRAANAKERIVDPLTGEDINLEDINRDVLRQLSTALSFHTDAKGILQPLFNFTQEKH